MSKASPVQSIEHAGGHYSGDVELSNLHVRYGPIHAVRGVNLKFAEGKITTVLGANGAGKSSTLKALAGGVQYTGSVTIGGRPIDDDPVYRRVRNGIALCPEGRGIFYSLTVKENLLAGAYTVRRPDLSVVYDVFPILRERANQIAGTLSGGEQQMLAIARALMSNPRYLLLDEPSLGLAPIVVDRIAEVIRRINERGITVILVEQNTALALSLASYAYILELGKVAAEGTPEYLLRSDVLREKYLGGVKR